MIAGLLVVGLVVALLGVWFFVEVIDFLHQGAKAFRRYLEVTDDPPEPVQPASPHTLWRTGGPGES